MTALAALAATLLGAPLAFTLAAYAGWSRPPFDPDAPPFPAGTGLRALLGEWLATALVLLARFAHLRDEPGGQQGTIVFVPEARCSSASFWLLRRRLRAHGWSSASTATAANRSALDAALQELDACVAGLSGDGAAPLVLVGHGLGGVVARRYAETHPEVTVRHVVTLGTAHAGSAAIGYRALGAGALAGESAALLAARADAVDVISIYSDYDAWLPSLEAAYCPGGFNVRVRGLGHFALLWSGRIAALVAENAAAPAPPRTGAATPPQD